MGPGKGGQFFRGENYLVTGLGICLRQVGHDRVRDVVAGIADEFTLVVAAVQG